MVLTYHYYFLLIVDPKAYSILYLAKIPFRLTWTGVDLFFVLSGYLIGGILLRSRTSTNYFSVFYRRRIFRIIPLYASLLLAAVIFARLVSSGRFSSLERMTEHQMPWVPYFLFLQNLWMVKYGMLGSPVLGVTWSLAVEEQFYLILPWIIRKPPQRLLLRVLLIGIISAPLLRIGLYLYSSNSIFSWFVLMPCRSDALLIGVLVALLMNDAAARSWLLTHRKQLNTCLLIALLGAAAFSKCAPSQYDFLMLSIGYTWMAILYGLTVLHIFHSERSALNRLLRLEWLGSLGTIAYGVYMLHQTILYLVFSAWKASAPVLGSRIDAFLIGQALLLTFAIMRMSWVHFEGPLMKIGYQLQYNYSVEITKPHLPAGESVT